MSQSQQRIQILGYHISVDAVIRDKISKTNFSIENNTFCKKNLQKKKKKTTPQHFCVAEDCKLLEGGVLYDFMGIL